MDFLSTLQPVGAGLVLQPPGTVDASMHTTVDVAAINKEAIAKHDKEQQEYSGVLAQPDFANYSGCAEAKLKDLEQQWSTEIAETERRRKFRNVEINVPDLRRTKAISADETIIPVRVANTNIERILPPMVAYLKQARRVAIFKDADNPSQPTEQLESEFTRVAQYDSWEMPFYKVLDGSAAQGWDAVEVIFDVNKPGHASVEHIGHEDLLFPVDTINLQSCEMIVRKYSVTNLKLRDFVRKFGFEADQVTLLLTNDSNNLTPQSKCIRKVMWKNVDTGVVWVAWYCLESCTDWLKKPETLFGGVKKQVPVISPAIQPPSPLSLLSGQLPLTPPTTFIWEEVSEKDYPFEILVYNENEEKRIFNHRGRIWYDMYKQEAQTAVWSAFINRIVRASNVYASPKQPIGSSADRVPKAQNMELKNGAIYDGPLEFWNCEYPDPMVIGALQYMDTSNAAENGQVNFAVNNRKDSRKTAAEIEAASQQSALINSVQVTIFSIFIRRIYTRFWRVVQSQALQGLIKFLEQSPDKQQILSQTYNIFAAGDVDVVQRQEKIQAMQQFWPVVANTPIAGDFLATLLTHAFPDEGQAWAAKLKQMGQQQDMTKSLATALAAMVKEFATKMQPVELQQVTQILQEAAAQTQQQQPGQSPTSPQPAQ